MFLKKLFLLFSFFISTSDSCNNSFNGLNNIIIDYNPSNVRYENGLLNMYLTKETGGCGITVGSSPIQYGRISVVLKTAPGYNVVSAFYLKAPSNGDEIDFEVVKNRTSEGKVIQTAFYYRGIPLYEVNARYYNTNISLSETYNNYTIIWKPDSYEWIFNSKLISKVTKNDTDTYPDTISDIKITVWEAKPSRWAGPGIDFRLAPFILSISSIEVVC